MTSISLNDLKIANPTVAYGVGMVICALCISILDSFLPQGVSIGEAYALLVLLGFMAKNKRLIIGGAIAGTVLTLEGAFISEPGVALWIVETNRALSIFIIWVIALFALAHMRYLETQKESEKMKVAYELLQQERKFLELNQEVAVLANLNDPVEEALKQCMQRICDVTGWPVAHLYIRDGDEERLSPSKIWILKDWKQFEVFRRITETTTFLPGEGLPGRVFASKQAAWIINVNKDANFPRAKLAEEIGLKAGFAFPILIGPKVVAVMEFYSEEALEPDTKLIRVMENIGYLLGRIFERDHAGLKKGEYEDHLRRLYARMKAVRDQEQETGQGLRLAEGLHEGLR